MSARKKYSIGIYTANGDLTKTWYIRWSYRNPKTGRLERQTNVKGGCNYYKTRRERLKILNEIKASIEALINNGRSPLDNDFEDISNEKIYSANEALNYALEIKKSTVGALTREGYYYESEKLKDYLERYNLLDLDIKNVNKRVITKYLNEVLKNSSARTRNNSRSNLSALFTVLKDNFIIERNFIKTEIPKIKAESKIDRTIPNDLLKTIAEYLKENDPTLLLYIKLVAYNFMRPVEVNRLIIKNIDLKGKRLYFQSKTKRLKVKRIPDIIIKDLEALRLEDFKPNDYLFTYNGGPGEWEAADKNRRDHYSKRFKKVKQVLGLTDYGIYSFRHSFITNLFRTYRKRMTFNEAIEALMPITGHDSKEGLINYIHKIDADIPEDWSKDIEVIL